VVLYKSGVGYFEHVGRVRGDQAVTIDLTSGQLDDVLKSLTTADLGNGRVTGITFNSTAGGGNVTGNRFAGGATQTVTGNAILTLEDVLGGAHIPKIGLADALEIHRSRIGKSPRGYRAPVYNVTQQVVDLLIEHKFLYESSLMADDIPYLMKTEKGELWEAPVHWGTDDWPPFAHYAEIDYMMPVKAPSEGLKAFWEEFDAQYEAGGFWIGIWHPFLTGRLARWRLVEQWLEQTLKTRSIWFAPLEDIIGHVKKVTAEGRYTPRVDQLPYYTASQLG
jgi:hypothetical protein